MGAQAAVARLAPRRARRESSLPLRILSEQLTEYERYAGQPGHALNAEAGRGHTRAAPREHQSRLFDPTRLLGLDDDRAVAMP